MQDPPQYSARQEVYKEKSMLITRKYKPPQYKIHLLGQILRTPHFVREINSILNIFYIKMCEIF